MSRNRFLTELYLAEFDARLNEYEEKIRKLDEAIRWEKVVQRLRSTLLVNMESAQVTREEEAYLLFGIGDDTPDELMEKIKFTHDRMPETRDPRKQFVQRTKAMSS